MSGPVAVEPGQSPLRRQPIGHLLVEVNEGELRQLLHQARERPLAIQHHYAAAVVLQPLAQVMQGQGGLAHPIHARDQHRDSARLKQLREPGQGFLTAYKR